MLPELIEASYLSRFFAKFTEIIAAGLATAMCAYLISYLGVGGPPPHVTPAPAAVSVAPSAGEVAASLPAQPAPPVAAAAIAASAVDEQRRVPQPVTDAPPAQPARKAEKAAMAVPAAPKDIKTGTSVARSEKSAEALARAALANVDADRPIPAAPNHRRDSTGAGSAGSAGVEVQQRPADVPPRQADIPPPPAAFEAPPRRVAAVAPLPPNTSSSVPEIAAPQPEPRADQHKGLFSFLKRGTPSFADEAPRPPLPVGTDE
jgi:hypothetical protein